MTFASREIGSGSRKVLESALARSLIPAGKLTEARIAHSPAEVAQLVAFRQVDAGIGPEPVARWYGLDFIPLQEVRYDIVVWCDAAACEPLQFLIDSLHERRMRAQLRAAGGFDTRLSGDVMGVTGE